MIKKNLMKTFSVIMAAMMAMMTVACGANTVSDDSAQAVVETQEEKDLEESMMASSAIASSEGEAGKVETVYVKADANGAVNDVVVSEWLKNSDASTELTDATDLKDIVNVKGSETFTDNGDGTLTWNASGADIYYQGTTDKELPVKMKITYTLNGKEITPEELAGKSGRVTIRFEYENTEKQTVEVDGKQIEVYTPFAMVSGMMLDSDKFTNVEISNGKVISDGGNYIVMGVAVPGLKESLNIDEDKWEELDSDGELENKLSNYFEVTADTSNFELGMTITMASSDILSDFGLSDLSDSSKIDDLKDDMGELNDGSTQLVDGTQTLKNGTSDLKDGVSQLYDGTKELKDGTQSLYEGVVKYTDGVSQVNDGAAKLAQGAATAKDGSGQLVNGMKDADIVGNAQKLADGAKQVSDGVNVLSAKLTGMSDMMTKLGEYQTMLGQIQAAESYLMGSGSWSADTATGFGIISKGQVTDQATADTIIQGASDTSNGVTTLIGGISQLDGGMTQLNGGMSTLSTTVSTLANYNDNVLDYEYDELNRDDNADPDPDPNPNPNPNPAPTTDPDDGNDNGNGDGNGDNNNTNNNNGGNPDDLDLFNSLRPGNGNADAAGDDDEEVSTADLLGTSLIQNNSDGSVTLTQEEYKELTDKAGKYDYLHTALGQLNTNVSTMSSRVKTMSSSVSTMKDSSANLPKGMEAVQTYYQLLGAAQAAETVLTKALGSASALAGSGSSSNGDSLAALKMLSDGAKQVADGNAALASGVSTIYNGAVALDEGLGQLSSGASELSNGTSTLASNNAELVDGTKKLNDGAGELNNGVSELNDGAIKLDDGVQELLDGMTKLDEEGIKKLYEAFDGDLSEFSDKMQAIQIAGENYTSFGGANADEDSSVKFIIKTDSIKSL